MTKQAKRGAKPDAKASAKPEARAKAAPEVKAEGAAEAGTDGDADAGGAETAEAPPSPAQAAAIPRKTWVILGVVLVAAWAFAISTGSTVVISIVGALTAVLAGVVVWALRTVRKHRSTMSLLQGGMASAEARGDALAKLESSKDAGSPSNVFARAQLLAMDQKPHDALVLLGTVELRNYPPAMQDDVSLLKAQLYLMQGRTADARKAADLINLENPQRKEARPMGAAIVAEAWARSGKPKEALALLETVELPKKDAAQIALQMRVARVFARFAANQRSQARAELIALADEDLNQLGRFMQPQFRVRPDLQKLARSVLEQHPAARRHIKAQTRRR